MTTRKYAVIFNTQRNRVYKTWQYIVEARSQKAAIEKARADFDAYYRAKFHDLTPPHMFHCEAQQVHTPVADGPSKFQIVDWRPVTWGPAGKRN